MEAIFIYLLKASVLIAVYFLAYYFFLKKETFFTTNRWFLLAGLATSTILPLFFIKKYIVVERPEITPEQIMSLSQLQNLNTTTPVKQVVETPIDWTSIGIIFYSVIAVVLLLKIISNVFSLFKLLYKKEIVKRDQFTLVDIDENISPFSFFNYIVYNSSYYTNEELQSILLHEKVHSQEKHSIDVLVARLFCIVFWFNPFIWLYKKAIIQNLEYIADSKASKLISDKKVYQKALLKVVTHQNCLAITNHFYQSLIKNRIVMLNKNESQKRNSWKYAIVIPVLIAFIIAFQIKTIAQEKIIKMERNAQSGLYISIDKNSSNEELKADAKMAKEKFGVTLKHSKIKRNSKGEITGIKVEFKDQNGKNGITHIQGDNPIKPIYFQKTKNLVGFGKSNEIRVASNHNDDDKTFSFSFFGDDDEKIVELEKLAPEIPESPESPEDIEAPKAPDAPELADTPDTPKAPKAPKSRGYNKSIIISKQNDGTPEVIINGKKLDINSEEYKKMVEDFNGKIELKMDENGPMVFKFNDDEVFKFNGTDVEKFTRDAMKNSHIQLEKMREKLDKLRPQMDKMKIEMEKIKSEDFNFNFNWDDKEKSDADMKKAREEMLKAKEEMLKARDEMMKARDEMMKTKSEIKTKKA